MVPDFPDVMLWSFPAFFLLGAVEVFGHRLRPKDEQAGYDPRDSATSISVAVFSYALDMLWKIPTMAVFIAVYELTPARVPVLWWTLPLMLLAQDFLYYWAHRENHLIRILWASHVVHHSSRKFNYSTALRQPPWESLAVWPFYLPLVACGVHPAAIAFCYSVNLVYQFWIHTERIGKLARWFEFVFNTPSHHRVHHASQGDYLDRNFGGVLIVWDRLFGSFAPEVEPCVYGLTQNIETYNPLRVVSHEYVAIGRDVRRAESWSERSGRVLRSPRWQPVATPRPDTAPEDVRSPEPARLGKP
ncbi:sterol desaturase family protein [Streptomyces oceani]|uniref:C-5 sterol desaturase n=1 Tax=Streptomyces oceani TaxID=1075402 RepID=A0A1E7JZ16_9ACTN|nr:sterol desaturase family protein [Streptomyces oceani]OEU96953.1 C-5 sterol desaturase [Streptomyces oceani]